MAAASPVAAQTNGGANPAPSAADREQVFDLTRRYFEERTALNWRAAYDLYAPEFASEVSFEQFVEVQEQGHVRNGPPTDVTVIGLTWYRDDAAAQQGDTGAVYAAVDYEASSARMYKECGTMLWARRNGVGFELLREDRASIPAAMAANLDAGAIADLERQIGCAESR